MEIEFVGPRFFSQVDECIFDAWLAGIPSVRHVYGLGNRLVVSLARRLPKRDLAELDALFRRYRLNKRVLSELSVKRTRRRR